jgi:hypothetical protein
MSFFFKLNVLDKVSIEKLSQFILHPSILNPFSKNILAIKYVFPVINYEHKTTGTAEVLIF